MADIDLSQVKWDEKPSVDLSQVKWDEPQKKVTLGLPGFAQSVREELALRNDPFGRVAMGVSGVVDDAAMRLKQLASNPYSLAGQVSRLLGINTELTPQEQQAVIGNRVNRESLEGMTGAVLGSAAMFGGPANAVQSATAPVLTPLGAAAAAGAGLAAGTNPVLPGESETLNAAAGAAGGAAGNLASRVFGRVFQVVRPTPDAQRLMVEGVQPTIGQAAGANSMLGRIEQSLQSIPIVGDIIRNARGRATEELNVAAIRRALPANANGQITEAGRNSIAQAYRTLSQGYDDVLTRINTVSPDQQFVQTITRIASDPDLALPQQLQQRYVDILRTQFDGKIQGGNVPADLAKRIDSNLGNLHRRYRGHPDGDMRALGDALGQAQSALRQLFERNAGPQDAAVLRELNGHYANLMRVERAAGSAGAAGGKADSGVFTPAQLSSAVRAMDPSRNKRSFAQGRALMQDLSDAGRTTLSETVPNSGTTDRALIAMALGTAGAGANESMDGPNWLTAAALTPLIYSRTGSSLLTGQLTPGLQQLIQSATPLSANVGSYLATRREK